MWSAAGGSTLAARLKKVRYAVARMGALALNASLSPEQRRKNAIRAARMRWRKARKKNGLAA